MHCSVLGSKNGSPQIDFFHQAAFAVDYGDIIDADLIFHHEKETAQDILDDALGSKSDGHSGDARAGEQPPDIEIEVLQDHERRDGPNENGHGFSGQTADGLGAFFEFVFASAPGPQHHSDCVVAQATQCPAYNQTADVGEQQDERNADQVEEHGQVEIQVQQLAAGHSFMIKSLSARHRASGLVN